MLTCIVIILHLRTCILWQEVQFRGITCTTLCIVQLLVWFCLLQYMYLTLYWSEGLYSVHVRVKAGGYFTEVFHFKLLFGYLEVTFQLFVQHLSPYGKAHCTGQHASYMYTPYWEIHVYSVSIISCHFDVVAWSSSRGPACVQLKRLKHNYYTYICTLVLTPAPHYCCSLFRSLLTCTYIQEAEQLYRVTGKFGTPNIFGE